MTARRPRPPRRPPLLPLLGLLLAPLGACTVGPDYHRPNAAVPLGWTIATPADGTGGGTWWSVFADPALDALEARVVLDNQTIKQAEAAVRQARALLGESRAGLFPTLGANGSATRGQQAGFTANSATLQATANWDLDVWGRIRRSIESSRANAQASAADLANATLAAQANLATLYFDLGYQDALQALLRDTVGAYQRALTITTNQARFGIAAPSDVITAQTQLDSAQSQLINAGVARAQDQHAIAAIAGVPPGDLPLPARGLPDALPAIPASLPATLLQRRPDIAAAERTMQAQNAQIGVAVAAYYPDISLSALYGYSGSPIAALFDASNKLWSIGTAVSDTLFDGGLRGAQVQAARAVYDQSVATYRQVVLNAFQQVEDNLSGLQILARQATVQTRADMDAARAVAIAVNQYQAGTQTYTAVVQAQTILLGDQQTALLIQLQRLQDSVNLLQALGGRWDGAMSASAVPARATSRDR